jgi:phosphoenolpyruvate carboxykinase (ATP)
MAQISAAQLVEEALARGEGELSEEGAFVVRTGKYTGRSPGDKFIVDDDQTHDLVDWGKVNQPFSPDAFARLQERVDSYLSERKTYVFDGFAGADPTYRRHVRVISEYAWHSLFARQLFIRPEPGQDVSGEPDFTIIDAAEFKADPAGDGTKTETFIIADFTRRIVLIGGTEYAGEIKKSVFTIMNYLLPGQDVFPMHCSASTDPRGASALFFGLSGTGKTTLSADPKRDLIGDDEHGWSDRGIFNFEGGCYAKCINLSEAKEPQIWSAIRFGAVLENVVLDPLTRRPRYDDGSLTENTRAAYPVDFIPGALVPSVGGHPDTVIFLTADAFGVLPPISRLTSAQAMYHFLSGYTSKLAGTERGVTEPQTTFSTCFAQPFLPLHPEVYAKMLGERLEKHKAACYLVNTGWSGGPYGVGHRIRLELTRAMVAAAINGILKNVPSVPDPTFGVLVPRECPGVPPTLLQPRATWPDGGAYDRQAHDLASRFAANFTRFAGVSDEIKAAGPALD